MPNRFTLRRVKIDRSGYDRSGEYFGLGWPVYAYANADGSRFGTLRARCREEAKESIRRDSHDAVFYN